MRQRNVKNQDEIVRESDRYFDDLEYIKGKIKSGKYDKICLEIGIGKGQFISEMARQSTNDLFIGIELSKAVVSLACKKIKRFEEENGIILNNLYVTALNALELEKVFDLHTVDVIYLNFSDPWPKKKHEKRRLTADTFLEIYEKLLKEDGNIQLKTDNRKLFEYSVMNFNKNKLNIENLSLDLHGDIANGIIFENQNIETEYEQKFKEKGPIYKMVVNFRRD